MTEQPTLFPMPKSKKDQAHEKISKMFELLKKQLQREEKKEQHDE